MTLLGSIRNRLVAGLLVLLGVFLAMALLSVASLRNFSRVVATELDLLSRSSALASALVGGAAGEIRVAEAYLLEPSEERAQEFLRLGDTTHTTRRQYRQLPGLAPEDQGILNRIAAEQASLEQAYATAHALRDLGRMAAARAAADRAQASVEGLVADVQTLSRRQQVRVGEGTADLARRAREREAVLWVLFGLATVFGMATALLLIRTIDSPLQELIGAARRFGQGDLRPARLGTMPRELATLAHAMGAMGGRLRSVIEATMREARGISSSASDLSAMSEELAATSHEIEKAIGSVTVGAGHQVREVRGSEGLLAKLREAAAQDLAATERVAALGESTRALAGRHGRDLNQAGEVLAALREDVRRAMGETRELSRQLDLVGSVADTAESLASQSEVLALNASVEAARSGANGGGFTAVAEETRRLTESSRVAALRVTEVVHGIRGRVDEVLAALQTAAVRVAETDATAQRSALALEEIGRLVDAMREIASRVARSAEESRRVGSRFGELRSHLERIAQENVVAGEAVTAAAAQQSGATDDIATSAAELLEASERLSALVAGFRV